VRRFSQLFNLLLLLRGDVVFLKQTLLNRNLLLLLEQPVSNPAAPYSPSPPGRQRQSVAQSAVRGSLGMPVNIHHSQQPVSLR